MLSAIRLSEIRLVGKTQSCPEMASSTRTMLQHGLRALCNGGRALIEMSFGIIRGHSFKLRISIAGKLSSRVPGVSLGTITVKARLRLRSKNTS